MNICRTIVLFSGLLFVFAVTRTEAILCYQCSTTSANSPCVINTHGLSQQRTNYEKNNESINNFPRLKDCSNYVDEITGIPTYQLCKLVEIKSGGRMNAFIRDCTDGKDFAKDFTISRLELDKYVVPNNETSCGYSHRHLANICVQICNTDFCNGPLVAGQSALTYSKTLTGLLLVSILLYFGVQK